MIRMRLAAYIGSPRARTAVRHDEPAVGVIRRKATYRTASRRFPLAAVADDDWCPMPFFGVDLNVGRRVTDDAFIHGHPPQGRVRAELHELEAEWAPAARGVSLLAELELGAAEIERALQLIGTRWRRIGGFGAASLSDSERLPRRLRRRTVGSRRHPLQRRHVLASRCARSRAADRRQPIGQMGTTFRGLPTRAFRRRVDITDLLRTVTPLASAGDLVIEGLTDDEAGAFLTALD